jgi:hypothetical protein
MTRAHRLQHLAQRNRIVEFGDQLGLLGEETSRAGMPSEIAMAGVRLARCSSIALREVTTTSQPAELAIRCPASA